ncbi:helix-turn-helix domain-containing protein [Streptomyces sp. NPDC050856]|uniref:nSTAND1 domain-containing NTPase n=1 Tax=Streptomyces sp. NPDC050856 TaxID=3154939 RepID=UPI0033C025C2
MRDPSTQALPTPPSPREEFAAELTRLREQAGLTVRKVAALVDMPGAHTTVGGWFAGRSLPSMSSLPLFTAVLRVCGVDDPQQVDHWHERLRRVRRARSPRTARGVVPYRGLASFDEAHADWFFGRDRLRDMVVGRLSGGAAAGPHLLVGASGSGKSSLLRAGVLPALRTGHGFTPVLLTPGGAPPAALAAALAGLMGGSTARPDTRDPHALAAQVRAWAGTNGTRVIVAVDQFEELFTVCDDPGERERFLTCLQALSTPRVRVVGGLRADFYGHALDHPLLAVALQGDQTVVRALSEEELRAAVTGPAAKAGLRVDEGFVDVLLADLRASGDGTAAHEAGALPLLSHARLTTWERGHGTTLTVADYRAGGGLSGAISESAEEACAELTEAQRAMARTLFLRMVSVGEDTADTRRLLALPPPHQGVPADPWAGQAHDVLERFVDRRLVTVDDDGAQITHEALLTAWPRLRRWIDTDRAGHLVWQELTRDAGRWQALDRDPSLLYRGAQLTVALTWAERSGRAPDLTPREADFLAGSRQAEEGRLERERRRTRHRRQLLAVLSVLVVLSALLSGVAVQQRQDAERQQAVALSRLVAANAERLRGDDPALAAQLSVVAHRTAPTTEARAALLNASAQTALTRITAFRGVVQSVALSPDGRLLAAGGLDRRVALWDVRDPRRPRALPVSTPAFKDTVYALAFSPDGHRLAAGTGDGTVRLWEPAVSSRAKRVAPTVLSGPGATVYGLAFSPDGRRLAAGSADGGVHVWPLRGGRGSAAGPGRVTPLRLTGFTAAVHTVAFRRDSRTLAAGGADGAVRLWDTSGTGAPVPHAHPLTGATGPVLSVAFTPDGRSLAAGSLDRSTRVWTVPAPGRAPAGARLLSGAPAVPEGPASYVNALGYSPDGRWLATGSADNQVRIHGDRSLLPAAVLPHPTPVTTLSFLPGGRGLVTGAADGTVRLWHLPPRKLRGFQGTANALAFSPDSRLLATAGRDTHLWDVSDPQAPTTVGPALPSETGYSGAVAFTPDGRTLAVGEREGRVRLWNLTRPARPRRYGGPALAGGAGTVQSVAFDRGGRRLAVGSEGRTVRIFDTSEPARPALWAELTEPTNYVSSVAFSADGRWLAAGTVDKVVHLWRVDGRRPVLRTTLRGPGNYVMAVAFSPDSRTLAAGTADRDVWLWDVTGPRPALTGPALTGPSSYVYALSFAPDGRRLTAASTDGTVWMWDTADTRRPRLHAVLTGLGDKAYAIAHSPDGRTLAAGGAGPEAVLWAMREAAIERSICSQAGSAITRAEWSRLAPGLAYAPPCR